MSTQDPVRNRPGAMDAGHSVNGGPTRQRRSTETKASYKTTEFFAYLAVVVGLLIAGNTVEAQEGGTDYFAADKVWLYITLVTIGYLVSRGLAKSGSRDPYWDDSDGHAGR